MLKSQVNDLHQTVNLKSSGALLKNPKTRRQFVSTTVGLGAFATIACKTLPGGSKQKSSSAYGEGSAAAAGVRVRNNLNSPAGAKDLESYRAAVRIMRKNGSWQAWAKLHEAYCPHGNWFFLPWHRWYLFHFEEACRDALRQGGLSDDFALPYWVWHEGSAGIPAPFWGVDNPLADPSRYFPPQGKLPPESCSAEVIGSILQVKDFNSFASGPSPDQRGFSTIGQLEGTPHNTVHSQIGGNMGTFTSPLDPIFWVHHANVDRLWAEWALKHPLSSLPSVPDQSSYAQQDPRSKLMPEFWLNFKLTGFMDPKGAPLTGTPSGTLDTLKMPKPYTYDTVSDKLQAAKLALADTPKPQSRRETFKVSSVSLRAVTAVDASNMLIKASVAYNDKMKPYMKKFLAGGSDKCSLVLTIMSIPVPQDQDRQKTLLKFFANHPSVTKSTSHLDPHFLATLGFFSHPSHAGHASASSVDFTIDLTSIIPKLVSRGIDLDEKLDLSVIVVDPSLGGLPAVEYFRPINLRLTYTEWT